MKTLVNLFPFQHNIYLGDNTKQLQASSTQPIVAKPQEQPKAVQKISAEELVKDVPPDKFFKALQHHRCECNCPVVVGAGNMGFLG